MLSSIIFIIKVFINIKLSVYSFPYCTMLLENQDPEFINKQTFNLYNMDIINY